MGEKNLVTPAEAVRKTGSTKKIVNRIMRTYPGVGYTVAGSPKVDLDALRKVLEPKPLVQATKVDSSISAHAA